MFEFYGDCKKFLYHYTKPDTAIEYILKHGTLRFSPFANTNDPKESKEWFFVPGTNENRNLSKYTPEYLSAQLNPFLKGKTRLLCFTKDQPLTGNHLGDMPRRGFCKSRMWAQYADNHRGACLIFDHKILSDTIHEHFKEFTYISDNVAYKDRLIADIQLEHAFLVNVDCLEDWGSNEYAYSHCRKYARRLFFEKALDWSNEEEYRWVVFNSSLEPGEA